MSALARISGAAARRHDAAGMIFLLGRYVPMYIPRARRRPHAGALVVVPPLGRLSEWRHHVQTCARRWTPRPRRLTRAMLAPGAARARPSWAAVMLRRKKQLLGLIGALEAAVRSRGGSLSPHLSLRSWPEATQELEKLRRRCDYDPRGRSGQGWAQPARSDRRNHGGFKSAAAWLHQHVRHFCRRYTSPCVLLCQWPSPVRGCPAGTGMTPTHLVRAPARDLQV